jgi:hypothetical protein
MANIFWYRIELNEKGEIVKRKRVARSGAGKCGSVTVIYVEASGQEDADAIAFKEYHRIRIAERRAHYAATGRCKCGRSREKETAAEREFQTCPGCRALHKPQHERSEARKKGLEPVAPISKADHCAARRVEEKLEVLREVQEKFFQMNSGPFGVWLAQQIKALEPKAPRKLRAV